MANRHRGEVEAELGERRYTLCLTLGALAELEAAFGAADLAALAARFREGRFAARDVVAILGAGLRGGGNDIADAEVAALAAAGGAPGYVRILADLLAATFGAADDGEGAASEPRPFPGTRR
jgi:hypothetical protein